MDEPRVIVVFPSVRIQIAQMLNDLCCNTVAEAAAEIISYVKGNSELSEDYVKQCIAVVELKLAHWEPSRESDPIPIQSFEANLQALLEWAVTTGKMYFAGDIATQLEMF